MSAQFRVVVFKSEIAGIINKKIQVTCSFKSEDLNPWAI